MPTSNRAYGELRDIVERFGGTMNYQREGYKYGAWIISLKEKMAIIEATGEKSFPELDQLYVPKIVNPKSWDDRQNQLLDDARRTTFIIA